MCVLHIRRKEWNPEEKQNLFNTSPRVQGENGQSKFKWTKMCPRYARVRDCNRNVPVPPFKEELVTSRCKVSLSLSRRIYMGRHCYKININFENLRNWPNSSTCRFWNYCSDTIYFPISVNDVASWQRKNSHAWIRFMWRRNQSYHHKNRYQHWTYYRGLVSVLRRTQPTLLARFSLQLTKRSVQHKSFCASVIWSVCFQVIPICILFRCWLGCLPIADLICRGLDGASSLALR